MLPIPMPTVASFPEFATFRERWKFPAPGGPGAEWFDAEEFLEFSWDFVVVGVAIELFSLFS